MSKTALKQRFRRARRQSLCQKLTGLHHTRSSSGSEGEMPGPRPGLSGPVKVAGEWNSYPATVNPGRSRTSLTQDNHDNHWTPSPGRGQRINGTHGRDFPGGNTGGGAISKGRQSPSLCQARAQLLTRKREFFGALDSASLPTEKKRVKNSGRSLPCHLVLFLCRLGLIGRSHCISKASSPKPKHGPLRRPSRTVSRWWDR